MKEKSVWQGKSLKQKPTHTQPVSHPAFLMNGRQVVFEKSPIYKACVVLIESHQLLKPRNVVRDTMNGYRQKYKDKR